MPGRFHRYMHTVQNILKSLQQAGSAATKAGMLRFGIDTSCALGVPVPALRKLSKTIGRDHQLALQLWQTAVHEARILASMVDVPAEVSAAQMDAWTKDFYSWDLCDQVCGNLFDKTTFAVSKALQYSRRKAEFVKRAGFVLMAEYAVHNKTAPDAIFLSFLPAIEREAADDRNFVKKAVNWALRQIGKRNAHLRAEAMATAQRILQQDSKTARWIATDALKELNRK